MKARAKAHGAISILNAILTGVGGAMGVDLWTSAEVEVLKNKEVKVDIPRGEDPTLAIEAAKIVLEESGSDELGFFVKTSSTIPIGKGLKSSSAAANAITLAACKAVGLRLSLEEVVRLSIEASIRAGVTITGAFDDAYTSFFGGINITDNRSMKVMLRAGAPEELSVFILVPDEKVYTKSIDVEAFKKVRDFAMKAVELALSGRYWDAMTMNGLAVAAAMDFDPSPILNALRKGALGAGVSGTGPAIAAIASPKKAEEVSKALERYGVVIRCKPNNRVASWEIVK